MLFGDELGIGWIYFGEVCFLDGYFGIVNIYWGNFLGRYICIYEWEVDFRESSGEVFDNCCRVWLFFVVEIRKVVENYLYIKFIVFVEVEIFLVYGDDWC